MWAPLALASALSLAPGQAGELKVTNPRTTLGIYGQDRKNNTYLPGDMLFVSFDILNLKAEDSGRIQYSMALELINKKEKDEKKKIVFTKEPTELESINSLGGSRLPA